jgi:hypothetical protein
MAENTEPNLDDLVMSITTEGRRYDIRFADFSAIDEMDYKQYTGYNLADAFTSGSLTSYMVAGLVWLSRRNAGESKLQFRHVAKTFRFGDLQTIKMRVDGDEEEADPIEAAESFTPEA